MLNIRRVSHLCGILGVSRDELEGVLQSPDSHYEDLVVWDPAKPNKTRNVVNVNGPMRLLQSRLYKKLLLPKLSVSLSSHGGVHGRSIKSNAMPHLTSAFIYKADISGFFPSVHYKRIYALFNKEFGCTPDVARICTRICSYRHHLALGLITSPILANQILLPVDARIQAVCKSADLTYTRFVDDLTISGKFDLQFKSGINASIVDILTGEGFSVNVEKNLFDPSITGVRLVRGHLDATTRYIAGLEEMLDDAGRLSRGEAPNGLYYTSTQIRGRIQFVIWLNPGRRRQLMARYNAIHWKAVAIGARRMGLVAAKKTLTPLGGP